MKRRILFSALIQLVVVATAFAQWRIDGVKAARNAAGAVTVSDGAGGMLIAWPRPDGADSSNVYVQRVDASGNVLWAPDGVLVCGATGAQRLPKIASDGAGGAFVSWIDGRGGSMTSRATYAQRVSAAGVPQWAADGIALSPPAMTRSGSMIMDGFGGAILTWGDERTGTSRIYAQRLNAAGTQWIANGIPLSNSSYGQHFSRLALSGCCDAVACWVENRGTDYQVYGQRIASPGGTGWGPSGVKIGGYLMGLAWPLAIAGDGAGGAIVAFSCYGDVDQDIRAQHVSLGGGLTWGLVNANGVPICEAGGAQFGVRIAVTTGGGAALAWSDDRDPNGYTVYAQQINSFGQSLWAPNGIAVSALGQSFVTHAIAADASSTVIAWADFRSGVELDLYEQKFNNAGVEQWTTGGVAVCTAPGDQLAAGLVLESNGDVIASWVDQRELEPYVYTERVSAAGEPYAFVVTKTADDNLPGSLRAAIRQANTFPAPQTISFDIPGSGVQNIQLTSAFPIITDALTIDGFTQPGAAANSMPVGAACDAQVMIELDGSQFGAPQGFQFAAANCTLRGVSMFGVYTPVTVTGPNAVIEGNYFGFSADGQPFPYNPGNGAFVSGLNCRIGGATAAARNVIGGFSSGVQAAGANGLQIYGNYFGISPDLATAQQNSVGVWLINTSGAKIGSSTLTPNSQEANIIANDLDGVDIEGTGAVNNMVIGNSFFGTSQSAIDLGRDGPTYNDRGDADTGPNNKQNQPVITSVSASQINGLREGIPGQVTAVHFYRSTVCGGSDGRGNAFTCIGGVQGALFAFSFQPAQPIPPGSFITCTATDLAGNTSELTNCIQYQNTGSGSNVTVDLADDSGIVHGTATYESVAGAGNTFITNPYPASPPVPGGFIVSDPSDPAIYFNITSTASYTGYVDVCLNYDENNIPGPESSLLLVHYNGSAWEDVTTLRDVVNNKICGRVTSLSPFVIARTVTSGVGDEPLPTHFNLSANVPNPFNPVTTIAYDIPAGGADVNITIYDVAGRLVRALVDEHRAPGTWSVQWNGDDDRGQHVASGVYFYRMRAGSFVETKKMVLLK